MAPAYHAPAADVGQALQGLNGDEEGFVGCGRREHIRICDGPRPLDKHVVYAGRLGDTPQAGVVCGGVGGEGWAETEHASVAAARCRQGMTGTGPRHVEVAPHQLEGCPEVGGEGGEVDEDGAA